ncbi:MAG TPA: hypothetical protein VNI01_14250 [Elusimicrobiota bacterium]|nr:hypothetical protein [Elusimicrobiota bacterium]
MRALPLLLAALLLAPTLARADVNAEVLQKMIEEKQMGLNDEESERAMVALSFHADIDLNQVRNARAAASPEFRHLSMDSIANPFDGSAGLSGGKFPTVSIGAGPSRVIDPKTGKPKEPVKRDNAPYPVTGSCSSDVSSAIDALRQLVRSKIPADGEEITGQDGYFFTYLMELFFPRLGQKPRFEMPVLIAEHSESSDAIATYKSGKRGRLAVECEKFQPFDPVMRRKAMCHEFYHWYQNRIGENEETPAYAIMPRC